jgi:hypothetical protein
VRHPASRPARPQQQIDQIDAGQISRHRLHQPRIAVDIEWPAVIVRHDEVDRQRAVPGEMPTDGREIVAHAVSPHAALDGIAAAGALHDLAMA